MVLSLLAIEVNLGIKNPILRLDGTPNRKWLTVSFSLQDYGVALLQDFSPKIVGKPERRSEHTHDR